MENAEIMKKCRICLEIGNEPMYLLYKENIQFENSNSSFKLIDIARNLLELQLPENDFGMKSICCICKERLISFYEFKIQAQKVADLEFPNIVIKSEIETNEYQFQLIPTSLEIKNEVNIAVDTNTQPQIIPQSLHTCPHCGKKVEKLLNFRSHVSKCKKKLLNASKEKPIIKKEKNDGHSCPYCKRYFEKTTHVKSHILKCKKNLTSKCCNRTFKFPSHLKRHNAEECVKKQDMELKYGKNPEFIQCEYCKKTLKRKGSSTHMNYCKSRYENCYVCDYCKKTFAKKKKLETHVLICLSTTVAKSIQSGTYKSEHFPEGILLSECEFCLLKFPVSSKQLMRTFYLHKSVCKRKNCPELFVYNCQYCKTKLLNYKNLQSHEEKCSSNTSLNLNGFDCKKCNLNLKTYALLKKHCKSCCPDDEILKGQKICEICDREFVRETGYLFKNHSDMHVSFNYLYDTNCFNFQECSRCKKVFSSAEKLDQHICQPRTKSDESEIVHKCTDCPKEFNDVKALKEHIVFSHLKSFNCPIENCQIQKTAYNLMFYHILKSHDGYITWINSFPCEYCKTDFESYYLLERHRKTGICSAKNVICDHCGKKYGSKRQLANHLLASLKRYICNFCGKKWSSSSRLNHHMRSHTNEKPYQCKICLKSFISGGSLASHIPIHSEAKNYECQYCDYRCKTLSAVRSHESFHTERAQCPLCENLFCKRYGVTTHLKTVHQITDPTDLEKLRLSVKKVYTQPTVLKRRKL